MSWEGHEEMGRGAIFANYDDARAGGKLNEARRGRRKIEGLCGLSFVVRVSLRLAVHRSSRIGSFFGALSAKIF